MLEVYFGTNLTSHIVLVDLHFEINIVGKQVHTQHVPHCFVRLFICSSNLDIIDNYIVLDLTHSTMTFHFKHSTIILKPFIAKICFKNNNILSAIFLPFQES